jgi:hypothetical protein
MAGICCVAPAFRRRGLFGHLERLTCAPPEGAPRASRMVTTGRMAHPASFRLMTYNPSHVPKRGVTPTRWQQAVGQAIAAAYGSTGFDPATFVVIGSGTRIGYPVMELEVTDEEREVFAPVNRDRGDSLLGMAWIPDAPDGWDDPDAPFT